MPARIHNPPGSRVPGRSRPITAAAPKSKASARNGTSPNGGSAGGEGRRERKKRETRERIYRTARRLFAERGFAETKVEDITAELDISVATFFNYYGSKDAVLVQLAEEMIDRFEALIATTGMVPPTAGAEIYLGHAGAAYADAPELDRRLLVDLLRVTLPEDAGARIARRVHAALERLLRAGQERGNIRTDLDASRLAEIAANILSGTFVNWLNDSQQSLPERLRHSLIFMGESMGTREGRGR